jgi:hypothetical protein
MRSRNFIMLLAIAAFACGLLIVNAQGPDDDVRGAFLSTRPKTTNTNAPRKPKPPHNTNSNSSTVTKNTNTGGTNLANANTKHVVNVNNAPSGPAIGLGYTLFMRDPNGRSVRVEPGREFHNGDRVRISLEPNVDGYLYVFHTEGNGPAEMIYPDPRLNGGENSIEAHVPIEVPSSEETDERLRWFAFYGDAGIERLFVVVTRQPLNSVPTGAELVMYCSANKDKCPWRPPADVQAQIQVAAKANVKVVVSGTFGQTETETEKVATTRGLGLDKSAPQPAVIRMNAAANATLLVAVLDLVHK